MMLLDKFVLHLKLEKIVSCDFCIKILGKSQVNIAMVIWFSLFIFSWENLQNKLKWEIFEVKNWIKNYKLVQNCALLT